MAKEDMIKEILGLAKQVGISVVTSDFLRDLLVKDFGNARLVLGLIRNFYESKVKEELEENGLITNKRFLNQTTREEQDEMTRKFSEYYGLVASSMTR